MRINPLLPSLVIALVLRSVGWSQGSAAITMHVGNYYGTDNVILPGESNKGGLHVTVNFPAGSRYYLNFTGGGYVDTSGQTSPWSFDYDGIVGEGSFGGYGRVYTANTVSAGVTSVTHVSGPGTGAYSGGLASFTGNPVSFANVNSPQHIDYASITVDIDGAGTLHPQPLHLTVTSKNGISDNWEILNSAGAVVMTYGVGANSSATMVYQAADGATGVYSFGYLQRSGTALGSPTVLVYKGSAELSSPDPAGVYSAIWSNPNPSAQTDAGNAVTKGANGQVTNNDSVSHTLTWTNASGTALGTVTVSAGSSVPLNAPTETLPPGSVDTLTLTDASSGQTVGTVGVVQPADGGAQQLNGSINGTYSPASGSPAQTGTQSNTGNASNGLNVDGQANNTMVNNAGTTLSGNSTGATNQDIYNDVKTGVEDANNQSYSTPSITMPAVASWPDTTTLSSNNSSIQAAVENELAHSGIGSLSAQVTAPSTIGTQSGISIPSIGILPAWNVDFTGSATAISTFRLLCLVAVNLTYLGALYKIGASTTT